MKKALLLGVVFLTLVLSGCIFISENVVVNYSDDVKTGRVFTITARVSDAFGKALSGKLVCLSGMSLQDTYCQKSDENGYVTFHLIEKTAGEKAYSLSVDDIVKKIVINVQKQSWVLGVYMGGDNTLDGMIDGDLLEMSNASKFVSVLALVDLPYANTSLYFLGYNGLYYEDSFNSNLNTGDKETLKLFLREVFSIEAEHYAIVLWDHGASWYLDGESRYYSAKLFKDNPSVKVIVSDDTSEDYLTLKEVREAFEEAMDEFSINKVDVLGMDACFMAQLGVLYELSEVADYLIASFTAEPGVGWDYDFLSSIDLSTTAKEFSRLVVDYYKNIPNSPKTLAAFSSQKIADLGEKVSSFGEVLKDKLVNNSAFKSRIEEYFQNSIHAASIDDSYTDDDAFYYFIDLYDFTSKVYENETDPGITSAANDVKNDVESSVISNYGDGMFSSSYGLGIFITSSSTVYNYFSPDMDSLLFYDKNGSTSGWRELLEELIK